MLQLELNHNNRLYAPGETLVVTAQWSSERAPRWIELSLEWTTVGKGTTDSMTVASERRESPGPSGKMEWSCKLPRGPLSLLGSLISIRWSVRGNLQGHPEVTLPIVVSPTGSAVRLRSVKD